MSISDHSGVVILDFYSNTLPKFYEIKCNGYISIRPKIYKISSDVSRRFELKRLTRAPLSTSSNTLHGPFMWYIKKGQGVGLYAGGGVSLNES